MRLSAWKIKIFQMLTFSKRLRENTHFFQNKAFLNVQLLWAFSLNCSQLLIYLLTLNHTDIVFDQHGGGVWSGYHCLLTPDQVAKWTNILFLEWIWLGAKVSNGKCSNIWNTFLFLISNKMLAGFFFFFKKMLVRIGNRENPDQTASSEAVWSGSALFD